MYYRIGIENNIKGRSLAWALEHPGCFAYGETEDQALSAMPDAFGDYAAWIESRSGAESWLQVGEIELLLEGSWEVYRIDNDLNLSKEGHEVNAWFIYDWKPLDERQVSQAVELLTWSRADLLAAVGGLSPGALEIPHPGERWNIAGILKHVGMAEWWYMDRLGLALRRQEVPIDPFERLEIVRARLLEVLPSLVGNRHVVGVDGEFWSARKILRRAVWHERDHTYHILKLR